MTDYSRLVRVTDGINNPNSVKTVPAPDARPSGKKSVLDTLEVRAKIADEKKSDKMMIIDDCQINKIMSLPRDERRKILSRLSDSQRRRLLSRYRSLNKVKDDASVEKLNYVNLDTILSNIVHQPDEYHKSLLTQWESAYSIPEEIDQFVQALENDDIATAKELLPTYKDWAIANDIRTEIVLEEPILNQESPEMDSPESEIPEGEFEDEHLYDSVRKYIQDRALLTPEIANQIVIAAKNDLDEYNKGRVPDVWKQADKTVADFTKRYSLDIQAVIELYNDAWNTYSTEYRQSVTDSINALKLQVAERYIMDSVLDDIAEKPLLDENGDEVAEQDERPFLEVLSQALEEFASGDDTLLNQLAVTTLSGDKTEDESDDPEDIPEDESEDSEEDSDEPDEGLEKEDLDKDPEDIPEDEPEDIKDSADDHSDTEIQCPIAKAEEAESDLEKQDEERGRELANLLLEIKKGTVNGEIKDSLNSVIDSLSTKVPALKKYNFRISDACPVQTPVDTISTMNPPLSRGEYYDIYPCVPEYFDLVCAQYDTPKCPSCSEYEVQPTSICVNPNTCPQCYYPYDCTLQEIADILAAADSVDYANIINQHCIPMSDALHLAALTNNLSFIDNKFYKKHVNDSAWSFDEVPDCLASVTDRAGSIELTKSEGVCLFGVNFKVK